MKARAPTGARRVYHMAPMTMDSLVFISERAQILRYQRPILKSHSHLMR